MYFVFLTRKLLSIIVADDILNKIFCFTGKIRCGISCKLYALQTVHMKRQALFSLKNKKIKKEKKCLKCCLLQL